MNQGRSNDLPLGFSNKGNDFLSLVQEKTTKLETKRNKWSWRCVGKMEISRVLKEKRKEKQWTQIQLAEAIFVSKKLFRIGKMNEQYQILKV